MNSDRNRIQGNPGDSAHCTIRLTRASCSFAVRWILLILGMAFLTSRAFGGSAEDFEAGRKAFRAGDIVTAMAPLRRASEAGHAAAQALYAQILDRSELDEEAVAWFRKSAEQNDPDGQFGLGSMLASGEGIKRDPIAARSWIEKSAAQGNGLAINFLAQSYINGQLGLTDADRSSPQALGVLKQAADLGFLPAIDALAQAYAKGGYGATPDPVAAEAYARKANEKRNAKAVPATRK